MKTLLMINTATSFNPLKGPVHAILHIKEMTKNLALYCLKTTRNEDIQPNINNFISDNCSKMHWPIAGEGVISLKCKMV